MKRLAQRFSRSSIRTRLFLLVTIILIASFTTVNLQQEKRITSIIQGEALEKAKSDLQTGMEIIHLKYPGEWRVDGENLYKGDMLINNNDDIVDQLGTLTNGNTVTLFLGDTRIATNVLADGKRAIGTKVSTIVAEKVLKEGQLFLGQANVVGHTYQTAYMPLKDAEGKIIGILYMGAPDSSERIVQIQQDITIKTFVSGSIIIVIALLLFYGFTYPMMKRIQSSVRLLRTIASGDLTSEQKPTKNKDETGLLLESAYQMSTELRTVLAHVNEASSLVAHSSQELYASTEQMSQATEQTNLAIQQIAMGSETQMSGIMRSNEAVQEVSRGMDQAAHAIQAMAQYASSARNHATLGIQVADQTIERMSSAQQIVEDAASAMQGLEEKSKEIHQIVEVITRIASQTNILALNASIEAVRAGEHGRGFAVVATEVRKLAEESMKSAELIGGLIAKVQAESKRAALAMNKGKQVVGDGLNQARQSGVAFDEISHTITEVSSHSQEVSAIIEQVHARTYETVNTMEQMAQIVQQFAQGTHSVAASAEELNASSEEISTSSANLGQMAKELRKVVGKFKVV
ncbi:methyl-accepting chemotaxis protein [Paenibacillus chungangensis]|uniref:Methyl-accepting chemotaxis protein n=1 Tax=Paenibacillus chungangensis TaxID=696535 RepID=A0ABW3HKE8_9BACL